MANDQSVEQEIRFFFPGGKLAWLRRRLKKLSAAGSFYEMTKMYNNPNPKYDYYRPQVDGRLRLRYSRSLGLVKNGTGLVSWKQRIPKHLRCRVRTEREIEFGFDVRELNQVTQIVEDVLRCPLVSSYERRRHFFHSPKFGITLDEFPFGLMLEFEFKKKNISRQDIEGALRAFDLKLDQASLLSCDDMYKRLCRKNHVKILPTIAFNDRTMPRL